MVRKRLTSIGVLFKMRKRIQLLSKRKNPEFERFLKENAILDEITGQIKMKDGYAYLGFNVNWGGTLYSMTYANAVWFLKWGKWPQPGHNIDHINDDPLDNRPENLQEITTIENHKKRRGRKVYRSYGRGKYGFGMGLTHDKRDKRFYVDRHLSRGHGIGDMKGIRYSLGGFNTCEEAEKAIAAHIEEIKINGLDYIPTNLNKKKLKKFSLAADANYDKMREMRKNGTPIHKIASTLGVKFGVVYNRVKDIEVDCRSFGKEKKVKQ